MRAFPLAMLAVLASLAACARLPPECRTPDVARLRTLDALIAETKANLDRGFAEPQARTAPVSTSFCVGSGSGHVGLSFCSGGERRVIRGPQAIDPAEERAKLAGLEESRARILKANPNALALCSVALAGR